MTTEGVQIVKLTGLCYGRQCSVWQKVMNTPYTRFHNSSRPLPHHNYYYDGLSLFKNPSHFSPAQRRLDPKPTSSMYCPLGLWVVRCIYTEILCAPHYLIDVLVEKVIPILDQRRRSHSDIWSTEHLIIRGAATLLTERSCAAGILRHPAC